MTTTVKKKGARVTTTPGGTGKKVTKATTPKPKAKAKASANGAAPKAKKKGTTVTKKVIKGKNKTGDRLEGKKPEKKKVTAGISPFKTGKGVATKWDSNRVLILKTIGKSELTFDDIVKRSKLDENRVRHLLYQGDKGGIIAVEQYEDDTNRYFSLTAAGKKIDLAKIEV